MEIVTRSDHSHWIEWNSINDYGVRQHRPTAICRSSVRFDLSLPGTVIEQNLTQAHGIDSDSANLLLHLDHQAILVLLSELACGADNLFHVRLSTRPRIVRVQLYRRERCPLGMRSSPRGARLSDKREIRTESGPEMMRGADRRTPWDCSFATVLCTGLPWGGRHAYSLTS